MCETRSTPGIRSPVPLALGAALFLAACSITQDTGFFQLTERGFPPRQGLAEVTSASETQLIDQGYVVLGMVMVTQELRDCIAVRCARFDHDADATTEARRIAAERGGDLILLYSDNRPVYLPTFQEGACLFWMSSALSEGKPTCVQYEDVYGIRILRVSQGTVWRREPNLSASESNRMARRFFEARSELAAQGTLGSGQETLPARPATAAPE